MIWVGGAIVPDEALQVSVLDRTFEHGLGLFETFRTWNGHATLLGRHLARMRRSARELRLPLDPSALPDTAAVSALIAADGREGDAVLRITMSGGLDETRGATVWMRSAPLPEAMPEGGAIVGGSWDDGPGPKRLAAHKTLNYWPKRMAFEEARARGWDESLVRAGGSRILEGCRTNVFLVAEGEVWTPPTEDSLLPGIMRQVVRERAPAAGVVVTLRRLSMDLLGLASEAFLTNSVRGIMPVGRLGDHPLRPGPVTKKLWGDIRPWLERGGIDP